MVICNSYVTNYQRVCFFQIFTCWQLWDVTCIPKKRYVPGTLILSNNPPLNFMQPIYGDSMPSKIGVQSDSCIRVCAVVSYETLGNLIFRQAHQVESPSRHVYIYIYMYTCENDVSKESCATISAANAGEDFQSICSYLSLGDELVSRKVLST